ncbi:hypothetical protein [Armatimonas rosea]|uniref:Uncharacterized protein n=1 Tax=Armatimonas rosea TaxID=685828 RepID=A0A7W9WAA7_ARMRO|nr:hypothetical protein [Armatimonas rosea]MBB6054121.1 hypothetical protein [Armatimonas rosea]
MTSPVPPAPKSLARILHEQMLRSWYETPLASQMLTPVEDDLLSFLRTERLPDEPLSWPEVRAELIAQGSTEAELDAERVQYREAMRDLRARLAAFIAATEHLEEPVPIMEPPSV